MAFDTLSLTEPSPEALMRGYVYVLVNSSLPGLVKVGKTTRLPSKRVEEISGATGVPTPFIVAYEQLFSDCDEAESYVHARLEQMGRRPAVNREFFKATTAEVIKIIMTAPGLLDEGVENQDDDLILSCDDELNEFSLEDDNYIKSEPWDDLMEEAYRYENGDDGYIQDYREAYKLYKDAARLGSAEAFDKLGEFHLYGQGVKEDGNKALDYFKEAVRRGYYYSYANMGFLFYLRDNFDNHHKCWSKLIEDRKKNFVKRYDIWNLQYAAHLCRYVYQAKKSGREPHFIEEIAANAKDMREFLEESICTHGMTEDKQLPLNWLNARGL